MSELSILLLDTEPRTHNRYLVLAIADALRRHPATARVHVAGHADALADFTDRDFDTLIAFGGARAHAPVVGRLANLARTSVLWTTEDPYERAANVSGSTGFDLVFTNDRASVAAYHGRARHLPLAASSLFHDLAVIEDDARYLYDLLFIGTAWPNRVATLNNLSTKLPRELKFKVALPWNEHIGPPDLTDDVLITDWRCGNRDFALLANRSRIVLTLPRAFSSARADQATGSTPPPRLFETALSGGYQVVVSPEPETSEYYAPGAEIALCTDESAAIEAIMAALARPDQRIAHARAAQDRTRAEHLYEHRVAEILGGVLEHRRASAERSSGAMAPTRTILMVTHNRAGYRPGGGVEVYQELLGELGGEYQVLFLFPTFRDGHWALRLEGVDVEETHACGAVAPPCSTDPFIEGLFQRILFEHRVDLVHIHHLMHLPLSLPLIARACGVPSVYHVHDHYLICERWLLLDHAGQFCDVVNRGSHQCDACLVAGNDYPPGSKARRDGFMELVTGAIDAFVTSTPETARSLCRFFPGIPDERVVEIEMVSPSPLASGAAPAPRRKHEARALTVAFVGNFSPHKGGMHAINLIRSCEGYPIRFKLIGRIDDQYRAMIAHLPPEQVSVTGPYDQHAVGMLLAGCDVSLHLSTWPETFVIALTEAWQAGLVPIVTDIGALAERVRDGVDGFKVRPGDTGAVRDRLIELHYDRARLAQMGSAVARKTFITVEDHLASVRALYERLIAARPCPHERVPDRLRVGFDLSLDSLGLRTNAPTWTSRSIRWDEAADPTAAQTAAPKSARAYPTSDLPDPYRRLTLRSVRRSECGWSLDVMRTDDRLSRSLDAPPLARTSVFLRGWLHVSGPAPKATFLRLTSGSGEAWAPLQADRRPDVAKWHGEPSAANSGFTGQIDVAGLPFGRHKLSVAQVVGDRILILEDVAAIFVAPDAEPPTRFVPEPRQLKIGTPSAFTLQHSLPELDGAISASPGSVWVAEMRLDTALPSHCDKITLVFQSKKRLWRTPVTKIDDQTIRVNAFLPIDASGDGSLSLAESGSQTMRRMTSTIAVKIKDVALI